MTHVFKNKNIDQKITVCCSIDKSQTIQIVYFKLYLSIQEFVHRIWKKSIYKIIL